MSVGESIRYNGQKAKEQPPRVFPKISRVNLDDLMRRVKEEEKKSKRNNLVVSVATFSAVIVFGIILTL